MRDYQVTKLPQPFIIDPSGVIRTSELFLKADKIKQVLDELLQEKSAPEE